MNRVSDPAGAALETLETLPRGLDTGSSVKEAILAIRDVPAGDPSAVELAFYRRLTAPLPR